MRVRGYELERKGGKGGRRGKGDTGKGGEGRDGEKCRRGRVRTETEEEGAALEAWMKRDEGRRERERRLRSGA